MAKPSFRAKPFWPQTALLLISTSAAFLSTFANAEPGLGEGEVLEVLPPWSHHGREVVFEQHKDACKVVNEVAREAIASGSYEIDGELAHRCLQSLPFESDRSVQVVRELRKFARAYSAIPFWKKPPTPELDMEPLDFDQKLEEIERRARREDGFHSDYEFNKHLMDLFNSFNDYHVSFQPWCARVFPSFYHEHPIVSIAKDENSSPEIFLVNPHTGEIGEKVLSVNGENVHEYLRKLVHHMNELHWIDPDARYNELMFSRGARKHDVHLGRFASREAWHHDKAKIVIHTEGGKEIEIKWKVHVKHFPVHKIHDSESFRKVCTPANPAEEALRLLGEEHLDKVFRKLSHHHKHHHHHHRHGGEEIDIEIFPEHERHKKHHKHHRESLEEELIRELEEAEGIYHPHKHHKHHHKHHEEEIDIEVFPEGHEHQLHRHHKHHHGDEVEVLVKPGIDKEIKIEIVKDSIRGFPEFEDSPPAKWYPEPLFRTHGSELTVHLLEDKKTAVIRIHIFESHCFNKDSREFAKHWHHVLHKAKKELKARGIEKLILDLSHNTGGDLGLGLSTLRSLFPKRKPFYSMDSRRSPLTDALVLAQDLHAYRDEHDSPFHSYKEFLGPVERFGDKFTRKSRWDADEFIASQFGLHKRAHEDFLPVHKVVFVTDGRCGSTCAVFAEALHAIGVRSAAYGGRPFEGKIRPMQSIGGVKGTEVLYFHKAISHAHEFPELVPRPLPILAEASVNFRNTYAHGHELPLEFTYQPAEYHFGFTPAMHRDHRKIWEAVRRIAWDENGLPTEPHHARKQEHLKIIEVVPEEEEVFEHDEPFLEEIEELAGLKHHRHHQHKSQFARRGLGEELEEELLLRQELGKIEHPHHHRHHNSNVEEEVDIEIFPEHERPARHHHKHGHKHHGGEEIDIEIFPEHEREHRHHHKHHREGREGEEIDIEIFPEHEHRHKHHTHHRESLLQELGEEFEPRHHHKHHHRRPHHDGEIDIEIFPEHEHRRHHKHHRESLLEELERLEHPHRRHHKHHGHKHHHNGEEVDIEIYPEGKHHGEEVDIEIRPEHEEHHHRRSRHHHKLLRELEELEEALEHHRRHHHHHRKHPKHRHSEEVDIEIRPEGKHGEEIDIQVHEREHKRYLAKKHRHEKVLREIEELEEELEHHRRRHHHARKHHRKHNGEEVDIEIRPEGKHGEEIDIEIHPEHEHRHRKHHKHHRESLLEELERLEHPHRRHHHRRPHHEEEIDIEIFPEHRRHKRNHHEEEVDIEIHPSHRRHHSHRRSLERELRELELLEELEHRRRRHHHARKHHKHNGEEVDIEIRPEGKHGEEVDIEIHPEHEHRRKHHKHHRLSLLEKIEALEHRRRRHHRRPHHEEEIDIEIFPQHRRHHKHHRESLLEELERLEHPHRRHHKHHRGGEEIDIEIFPEHEHRHRHHKHHHRRPHHSGEEIDIEIFPEHEHRHKHHKHHREQLLEEEEERVLRELEEKEFPRHHKHHHRRPHHSEEIDIEIFPEHEHHGKHHKHHREGEVDIEIIPVHHHHHHKHHAHSSLSHEEKVLAELQLEEILAPQPAHHHHHHHHHREGEEIDIQIRPEHEGHEHRHHHYDLTKPQPEVEIEIEIHPEGHHHHEHKHEKAEHELREELREVEEEIRRKEQAIL